MTYKLKFNLPGKCGSIFRGITMPLQTIETLVDGGKATAAPPLGPALGPLGVNIGQVVAKINEKTKAFEGMKVPVKVTVNSETKEFEIKVGTPPSSQLIKKEANIEKGSGKPKTDYVADILIEQIIKIAKMKEGSLTGKTLKQRVKEIIGTCNSMGILVEGKQAAEAIQMVNDGKFDAEIKAEKTELTAEEKAQLEAEKLRLAEEIKKRREEFERVAKEIIASMAGKERGAIKAKLKQANIPDEIIKELLPVEGAAAPGAPGEVKPGAKPAAVAKPEAKKEEKK